MSIYSKIKKNLPSHNGMECDTVTVPSMAYTPKEILERFVSSDLSLAQHEPTDDVVDVMTNEQFDQMNPGEFQDPVEFEDKFDAMDYVADQQQNPINKSKKRKESKENADSDNTGNNGNSGESSQQPNVTVETKRNEGEDNSGR